MSAPTRPPLSPRPSSGLGSPSLSATSSTRNPLHLKVTRLLASNLEDQGTRAALDTLGEFEAAQNASAISGAAGNGAKGQGIGGALRRGGGLRKEVQGRMAEGSREFLAAFSEVNDKLSNLQAHLDAMHVCCDQVQSELEKANTGTRYLLEHAEGLRSQRISTTQQQTLTHLFLSRFTLTDAELRALSSREVPVGRELFEAMDKTERIRGDCRALLGGEAGEGMQAGLDIMSYTSTHLDSGYSKIFKWCSFESRGFSKDALEVSGVMREAIRRLKKRPEMLSEVLSLLSSTRSTSLLSSFLDALTRGGPPPTHLPRPIELHAHDPIRYIGDMLAWIHQTMAGEREWLGSLFGRSEEVEGRWVGAVRVFNKSKTKRGEKGDGAIEEREREEGEERLRELLDRDMEGCGRPLKIRVLQTVSSQEGSIMAYRIATLIHFYKITLERTIGEEAGMSKVLSEITDSAYSAFFETLKTQGRSLTRFIQPPSAGLSAPPQLRESIATLREIMSVYTTSLLQDDSLLPPGTADTKEVDFAPVLSAALDPALEMCKSMAIMRDSEWDRAVFGVNCLECAIGALEGFGFTAGRCRELEEEEEGHVETLTGEHFQHLLKDSGLEPIISVLSSKDAATPLSHLAPSSPAALQSAIATFSSFLSSTDPLSSPRLSLLPPRIAGSIHRAALDRVSRAYAEVWEAVMAEENRYEARETVMRWSREEVQVLLGLGD